MSDRLLDRAEFLRDVEAAYDKWLRAQQEPTDEEEEPRE